MQAPKDGDAYFQFARNMVKGMAKNFPAPAKCVDAVEAATKKKFEDGLLFERDIFLNLMWTPECRSLRHLFVAERAASKIPDVPEDTPKRDIRQVGIIGAGTMGGGIAMNFLNAGIACEDAGNEAGSAGPWRGRHAQELRSAGQKRQAQARQAGPAHGAAQHHAELRRPGRCRPGDRGRV
jgi:hypothetical protein